MNAEELYNQSIKKVLFVRNHRQQLYGDGWITDPIDYNIWMCYGKSQRLIYMLKNGDNSYEKMQDSVIDLINYGLFLLSKLELEQSQKH